jgi:hypothetical protein
MAKPLSAGQASNAQMAGFAGMLAMMLGGTAAPAAEAPGDGFAFDRGTTLPEATGVDAAATASPAMPVLTTVDYTEGSRTCLLIPTASYIEMPADWSTLLIPEGDVTPAEAETGEAALSPTPPVISQPDSPEQATPIGAGEGRQSQPAPMPQARQPELADLTPSRLLFTIDVARRGQASSQLRAADLPTSDAAPVPKAAAPAGDAASVPKAAAPAGDAAPDMKVAVATEQSRPPHAQMAPEPREVVTASPSERPEQIDVEARQSLQQSAGLSQAKVRLTIHTESQGAAVMPQVGGGHETPLTTSALGSRSGIGSNTGSEASRSGTESDQGGAGLPQSDRQPARLDTVSARRDTAYLKCERPDGVIDLTATGSIKTGSDVAATESRQPADQVVAAVLDRVQAARSKGRDEATVQIQTDDGAAINVKIAVHRNQVWAKIGVSTAEMREALACRVWELGQRLESGGLVAESIEVVLMGGWSEGSHSGGQRRSPRNKAPQPADHGLTAATMVEIERQGFDHWV